MNEANIFHDMGKAAVIKEELEEQWVKERRGGIFLAFGRHTPDDIHRMLLAPEDGMLPIHRAIEAGDQRLVGWYLLLCPACATRKTATNELPLLLAIKAGNVAAVRQLINHYNTNDDEDEVVEEVKYVGDGDDEEAANDSDGDGDDEEAANDSDGDGDDEAANDSDGDDEAEEVAAALTAADFAELWTAAAGLTLDSSTEEIATIVCEVAKLRIDHDTSLWCTAVTDRRGLEYMSEVRDLLLGMGLGNLAQEFEDAPPQYNPPVDFDANSNESTQCRALSLCSSSSSGPRGPRARSPADDLLVTEAAPSGPRGPRAWSPADNIDAAADDVASSNRTPPS